MENETVTLIELTFWLYLFVIWIYAKYIIIRSLYNQKYQDKIDYLKRNPFYFILWKYMEINQVVFRMILKGEIK